MSKHKQTKHKLSLDHSIIGNITIELIINLINMKKPNPGVHVWHKSGF